MNRKIQILLYVPNLIGYLRIFLLVLFFRSFETHHSFAIVCAIVSHLLDAVDGFTARALGQQSEFGYHLDMLIDRMATLIVIIKIFQVSLAKHTFMLSLILFSYIVDICSHWL